MYRYLNLGDGNSRVRGVVALRFGEFFVEFYV